MEESGTYAVVTEADALDESYRMGFDRFHDPAGDHPEGHNPMLSLDHFTETARYVNSVVPTLRAMAGYTDSGPGTYTVERPVVVIPQGNEDDQPASGRRFNPDTVLSAVVSQWRHGALDALDPDRDRGDTANEVQLV